MLSVIWSDFWMVLHRAGSWTQGLLVGPFLLGIFCLCYHPVSFWMQITGTKIDFVTSITGHASNRGGRNTVQWGQLVQQCPWNEI